MAARLVLDTDIGTDVDDALALAFALRHPDIDLAAVTTVTDDTRRRAHIAATLLRLAGRGDVEVAPGVGWTDPPSGRRSWFGHEGEALIDPDEAAPSFPRDGVTLLLEETASVPTEIATVGMQSNIAAAIERDGAFAERVPHLYVMGGVFAPVRAGRGELPASSDHNLMVDPPASIRALGAGIPTTYVPLDVTVQAPLRRRHLERLRDADELSRGLGALIDVWTRVAPMPDDVVALLHDPLTVACVVDRRFVTTERLPVTVAVHDGAVRTFVDRAAGHDADVVTSVDGDAFADFWLETVLG